MRIFLLFIISSGFLFGALPGTIILTDSVSFPVEIQGKIAGAVKAPKGTSVELLGVDGDKVRIRYNNLTTSIPTKQTNLQEYLDKQRFADDLNEQRRIQDDQKLIADKKAAEEEKQTAAAKENIEQMRRSLTLFEGSDSDLGEVWKKRTIDYIKSYERASLQEKQEIYKKYEAEWNNLLKTKPIFGFTSVRL